MTDTQLFPLEKILTLSAGDYTSISGRDLSEYTAVGVHYIGITSDENFQKFRARIPIEAEIVIDYKAEITSGEMPGEPETHNRIKAFAIYAGTALIAKPKRN